MSTAFGISPSEMENVTVQLIQENRIDARVDSQNKVRAQNLRSWNGVTDLYGK